MYQLSFASLFISIFLPFISQASWTMDPNLKSAIKCSQELFGEEVTPVIWKHGNDLLAICSSSKVKPNSKLLLKEMFQIEVRLNGKEQRLAYEGEVGNKPKEIKFSGDDISITSFLGEGDSAYYTQTITCTGNNCQLSKPKCLLKHETSSQAAINEFDKKLTQAVPDKKLQIWSSYFSGAKKNSKADKILREAMLGNDHAKKLVTTDVGADGADAEIQAQLASDIEEARKICMDVSKKP